MILSVISMVIDILQWAIILRWILAWFPNIGINPLVRIVFEVTEPLIKPFRKIRLGGAGAMIDFSAVFAILALTLIQSVIVNPLYRLALHSV